VLLRNSLYLNLLLHNLVRRLFFRGILLLLHCSGINRLLRTLVEGSYENFSFNYIALKSDFPCYNSQVEGGFALV